MTWGLNPIGGGTWQVSPSIDFRGVWHQTPKIVNVPDGEPVERPMTDQRQAEGATYSKAPCKQCGAFKVRVVEVDVPRGGTG